MSDVIFIDHSGEVLQTMRNEIERAIAIGTIQVQNEAKRLVNRFSGPTKGNPHAKPSKPGEPPHIRFGKLLAAIDEETFTRGQDFVGRVGTELKYGIWHELGYTPKGGKFQKRPYLRPALDNKRKAIIREIRKAGKRMGKGG